MTILGIVNFVIIQMKIKTFCPRCGKTNPAEIHTCTPKEVMEQAVKEKPIAYYDPVHDKLLWADGPQYVHAQKTKGMSLVPLYPHPPEPKRKPLDGDEVLEGFYKAEGFSLHSFTEGVRWAEKHHGIGGDDGN